MRNFFLLLSISGLFVFTRVSAQKEEIFKPNGKPEVRIFTSFSSAFSDGNTFNKFDVTRAYLGYIYNFSKNLTGRITYDVGNPASGKLQFTGMLKFAYLQYHTSRISVTGGMMLTPQYEAAEKRWGFRYVYRSFLDEYGFGPAPDLGINAVYNFRPWLTADIILVNGEGYKLMEADSVFKAGFGITLIPVHNLSLRGYCDRMKKKETHQQTFELIAAYENKKLALAYAFNYQTDHALVAGQNYQGFSVNGSLFISDHWKCFARFDRVASVKINHAAEPWNLAKDGRLYIAGIEFLPAPGVRLSPNFQGWQPAGKDKPFLSRISLNVELRI